MKKYLVRSINLILIVGILLTYNAISTDRIEADAKAREAAGLNEDGTVASMYEDGTFRGEAQGYGGPVVIDVTIKDGEISKVELVSADDEDAAYWDMAKVLITTIEEEKTTEVDTISGATFSSDGIIGAVDSALEEASK